MKRGKLVTVLVSPLLSLSLSLSLSLYIYIYIYVIHIYFFFHIQRVKPRAIPCPHQPPTKGDNRVLVAQGGSATPGATKKLLSLDWVFRKIIYIYIFSRSTKSRDYIVRSSSYIYIRVVNICIHFNQVCEKATYIYMREKEWGIYIYIYVYRYRESERKRFVGWP